MPKIVEEKGYDGALRRIERLGLAPLLDEVRRLITGFPLLIEERRHENSGGVVRRMLDDRFHAAEGWRITKSGGIDWQKCIELSPSSAMACIGVELQVSARSDLLTNDLTHLMRAIEEGITAERHRSRERQRAAIAAARGRRSRPGAGA